MNVATDRAGFLFLAPSALLVVFPALAAIAAPAASALELLHAGWRSADPRSLTEDELRRILQSAVECQVLISEFADKIGVSRADVENWTSRLELSTEYAATRRGAARHYSRENVLELALLAALVRVGWSPRSAAEFIPLTLMRPNEGPPAWAAFPAGGSKHGVTMMLTAADVASLGKHLEHLAGSSPNHAASVIHIGRIVEIVDRLFVEKEVS